MGRLPHRLDRPPQNGDISDQQSAESPNTAPAIQSGSPISRVSGGKTAAISIVLPAPIAMREKNKRKNAPRLSGRDMSGGIICPALMSSVFGLSLGNVQHHDGRAVGTGT